MINKVEHLYIHIPLCKAICDYCDFVREKYTSRNSKEYITYTCKQLVKYKSHKFKTIYIGGGTPNCLDNLQLEQLLSCTYKLLQSKYEFTIECNPEFVNQEQINLFKKYKVNRISLGVQTTNNKILTHLNRHATIENVINAIKLLQKNNISNISIDLLYGMNELTNKDIHNAISFIKEYNITHVSWYALELKPNSLLTKNKYQLSDDKIQHQHHLIIQLMQKLGWYRYEVSSWCKSTKYQSKHNLAYWNTKDWVGIGLGAYGLEKRNYYHYIKKNNIIHRVNNHYTLKQYYQHILIMGLRQTKGVNLKNPNVKKAYTFYKNKLINTKIIRNYLICTNIDFLDDTLVNIV